MTSLAEAADMKENEDRNVAELRAQFERNVFVIIRYGEDPSFEVIEETLREEFTRYGLVAQLAKDKHYADDLWTSMELCMQHSKFAVAIFENIEKRGYNPNVSLEVGYMKALKRKCLLLKEKQFMELHSDLKGMLFRPFDLANLRESLREAVSSWCSVDLRLSPAEWGEVRLSKWNEAIASDRHFSLWKPCYSAGGLVEHFATIFTKEPNGKESFVLQIAAVGAEMSGGNKCVPCLFGRVEFEYFVARAEIQHDPSSRHYKEANVYFCMIPMREDEPGRCFREVGGRWRGDQACIVSRERKRYFVRGSDIGTGEWYKGQIDFDFRNLSAAYSIFGVRINEGCDIAGMGRVLLRDVVLTSYEPD